jgi:hypothetical protein
MTNWLARRGVVIDSEHLIIRQSRSHGIINYSRAQLLHAAAGSLITIEEKLLLEFSLFPQRLGGGQRALMIPLEKGLKTRRYRSRKASVIAGALQPFRARITSSAESLTALFIRREHLMKLS